APEHRGPGNSGFADVDSIARAGSLYCSPSKDTGRRTYHLRGKGELVPGRMQTAVVESSGAENPHVPVMKLWVVSLSPTFPGRDLAVGSSARSDAIRAGSRPRSRSL